MIVVVVNLFGKGYNFKFNGLKLFWGSDVGKAHPSNFKEGFVEYQDTEGLIFDGECTLD